MTFGERPGVPSWAGLGHAARLPVLIVCISAAGAAGGIWGGGFTSYLQMRATARCGPAPAGVPWQAALTGHVDGAATLLCLTLCCLWCWQRWKAKADPLWILLTLLALIPVIVLSYFLTGLVLDLNPAGYIPNCGHSR